MFPASSFDGLCTYIKVKEAVTGCTDCEGVYKLNLTKHCYGRPVWEKRIHVPPMWPDNKYIYWSDSYLRFELSDYPCYLIYST